MDKGAIEKELDFDREVVSPYLVLGLAVRLERLVTGEELDVLLPPPPLLLLL